MSTVADGCSGVGKQWGVPRLQVWTILGSEYTLQTAYALRETCARLHDFVVADAKSLAPGKAYRIRVIAERDADYPSFEQIRTARLKGTLHLLLESSLETESKAKQTMTAWSKDIRLLRNRPASDASRSIEFRRIVRPARCGPWLPRSRTARRFPQAPRPASARTVTPSTSLAQPAAAQPAGSGGFQRSGSSASTSRSLPTRVSTSVRYSSGFSP
ncbi:MAG: hypothetical protein HYV09_36300 [Deltaproteobacteria bacterium]|nr:hypothetical protein [Deltaproteobacteria bacterium]